MLIIPKNTTIFEPDAINRVTLMFPDQDSAIIFYEFWREKLGASSSPEPAKEKTRPIYKYEFHDEDVSQQ